MARGQQFPNANEPIAQGDGKITRPWFAVLNSLWRNANGGTVTGSGTAGRLAKWLTASSLTDALAAASSRLLGSGASGSGAPYSEITLGTNLSMSGTTLNAASGGGTVTHTGNLTANNLVVGNGVADLKTVAATNGQVPIGSTATGAVTLAALTAGTNITIGNGPGAITINATAGAGGTGNSIYTGAAGAEPAANTGDLYLPNNGYHLLRYSGSVWVPWGPIWPMTDPTTAGLSTNINGASPSTATGALVLTAAKGSSDNFRLVVKTVPATPYTITAAFIPSLWMQASNNDVCGVCWRDSATGKFVAAGPTGNNADKAGIIGIYKYTNPTTFVTAYGNFSYPLWMSRQVVWMQIADDGVNRTVSFSGDAMNWILLQSTTHTDFLTPDQVGIYASSAANLGPATITLLSWVEA